MAAIVLTAAFFVSLHHTPSSVELQSGRTAIVAAQTHGHSHDNTGLQAQMEEHSHPHCVLPCAAKDLFVRQATMTTFSDEAAHLSLLPEFFRPPIATAL